MKEIISEITNTEFAKMAKATYISIGLSITMADQGANAREDTY
jgi:hypothetical protein